MKKHPLKSRTLWIGWLILVASIASYLADAIDSGTAKGVIMTDIVMIVMRWVTSQPIGSEKQED